MAYFLFALTGFLVGGLCIYVVFDAKRKSLYAEKLRQDGLVSELKESRSAIEFEKIKAREEINRLKETASLEIQQHRKEAELQCRQLREATTQELSLRREELEQQFRQLKESTAQEFAKRREDLDLKFHQQQAELKSLELARKEFDSRMILYSELQDENSILKRDLANLAINIRKLSLDTQSTRGTQAEIDRKVQELGSRYLKENVKWIGNSLNPNNFANCKQKLLDVVERCRAIGFPIPPEQEQALLDDLRVEYEKVVRAAFEREEQARIKAQIREEQQREREIQRELDRVERERIVLEAALAKALAEAEDQHSAEIEGLRQRLEQAEANKRAISQAQLTKAGFVYVISNIGSFGEGVFKIGMTRRLVPQDRVRELGDASVPFPFDVHMMISCDNAPALENALHKRFLKHQINRTNPRKEFFRTDIESIAAVVKENHGEVSYLADPEALEYRQSLTMSDEDQEFIEHVFEDLGIEDEPESGDDA
jgi:hypothetical protein